MDACPICGLPITATRQGPECAVWHVSAWWYHTRTMRRGTPLELVEGVWRER